VKSKKKKLNLEIFLKFYLLGIGTWFIFLY